eukprot:GHVL01042729.1.p1 GENE.GHVL01042729.1~~GHVL01042729.1.p1  ORF type:complete len:150 (-),score=23.71 GHVL01042729.1:76-462(-)
MSTCDWPNGRIIGKGSFAICFESKNSKTQQEAVKKVIDKKKMKEGYIESEISILSNLNHPFINKLFHHFENENSFSLVLEHLKGGEVFQRINNKGPYKEAAARQVMRRLLSSLEYLHSKNILHRLITR